MELRGVGAVVAHGGKTYNLGKGALPDDLPDEVIAILRRRGAIKGEGPALEAATGLPVEPEPEPEFDPASASVEALAKHIDEEGLNASATVDLAGGDPDRARRVIEAENLAHGGDGRVTVLNPLEALASSGGAG